MKTKVLTTMTAITLMFGLILAASADLAGINKRSPFANRRAATQEQVEDGLPRQENPDIVIGGKARIGSNVDESTINVDGSINPRVLVNAPASVQLETIEKAAEAEKDRLAAERAAWEATQDTAVNDSEREQVYKDAAAYLAKSLDTSLSRADREFYAKQYTKTKSQLQNATEVGAVNNGVETDDDGGMSLLAWILWIGCPLVLIAGIVTAVVLIRRHNDDDEEEDEEPEEGDETEEAIPDNGAQVHVS